LRFFEDRFPRKKSRCRSTTEPGSGSPIKNRFKARRKLDFPELLSPDRTCGNRIVNKRLPSNCRILAWGCGLWPIKLSVDFDSGKDLGGSERRSAFVPDEKIPTISGRFGVECRVQYRLSNRLKPVTTRSILSRFEPNSRSASLVTVLPHTSFASALTL
jgi:hypothetical protein